MNLQNMRLKKTCLSLLFLFSFSVPAFLQNDNDVKKILISGVVKDEFNQPLSNVVVVSTENKAAVTTSITGLFQITVARTESLHFSKDGYTGLTVFPPRDKSMEIVLRSEKRSLNDIDLVKESSTEFTDEDILKRNKDVNNEIIQSDLQDYKKYSGSGTLSAFHMKENTQGSRYLLKNFGSGALLDSGGIIKYDKNSKFNFDKISNRPIMKIDDTHVMELDFDAVSQFKVTDGVFTYLFEKIPLISQGKYFIKLNQKDGKFEFVKLVKTTFEAANYQTAGMVESGHNYDLYADEYTYYLVNVDKGSYNRIDLKRRFVEKFFSENAKATEFFKKNDSGPTDESYIINLVNYINDTSTN